MPMMPHLTPDRQAVVVAFPAPLPVDRGGSHVPQRPPKTADHALPEENDLESDVRVPGAPRAVRRLEPSAARGLGREAAADRFEVLRVHGKVLREVL